MELINLFIYEWMNEWMNEWLNESPRTVPVRNNVKYSLRISKFREFLYKIQSFLIYKIQKNFIVIREKNFYFVAHFVIWKI